MDLLTEVDFQLPPTLWGTWQPGRGRGTARLESEPDGQACWVLCPSPNPDRPLTFLPRSGHWHRRIWTFPPGQTGFGPVPLPRLSVDSPNFPTLLAFTRHLTGALPPAVRRGWPAGPVAVDPGQAVSGEVNLSACLRTAMEIWNGSGRVTWFREADSPAQGVRLVFLPERTLHPPLTLQLTRVDTDGAPLRMKLTVGNNYQGVRDSVYVVRGFVHELAHVLLLWGHSPDRNHVLWERGPPLVGTPSQDERKAALLVRGLAGNLDLSGDRSGQSRWSQ